MTPSPHRFLSASGARQAKSTKEQRNTTGIDNSPRTNLSKSFGNKSVQSLGTPLGRSTPRFISKSRFAGPGSPVSESSQYVSPRVKKDRVEEFDHSLPGFSEPGRTYSASSIPVKQSHGRERIDESTDDDEEDPQASGDIDDEEDYVVPTSTRKRKLPSRSPWSGSVPGEQHLHKKSYQTSPLRNAPRFTTVTAQVNQDASSDVLHSSRSIEAPLDTESSRPSSVVSPFGDGHNRPRFDFAKLTERSSSKLQKITGTGQFLLDSTATSADNQQELLNSENINLTLLFSPQKHKKYQYAPGGLASTVRDWVLDAAVGINNATILSTVRVISIEAGERGSRLVCGMNKLQEKERFLLLGEARGSRNAIVVKGCHITIMEPSWTLESDGELTVAMNWKVVGAS